MNRTRIVASALFVFALAQTVPAQSETIEDFHKTFTLAQGAPVRVSNSSGKVEVSSWDKPYADVHAIKRSHNGRPELDRISIQIKTPNGSLDIQTIHDCSRNRSHHSGSFLSWLFGGMHSGSGAYVDYTIRIPRTALLERVNTSSGDIDVRDVHGNATIQASSGDITVSGADGILEVRTSSGNIGISQCRLRLVHSSSGGIQLQNVRGDFRVESSSGDMKIEGAEGRIDAHSSSGDITVRDVAGMVSVGSSSGDVRADNCALSDVHTTSGSIISRGVRGDMRLRTSSGTVQVSGTNGTADAHSTSGDIWLEGLVLRGASSSSGDIRVRAAGLADSVRLATTSGDISVDVPDNINADLVMETSSGDLVNRSGSPFSVTMISRRKIAGHLGSGGAPFVVHTSSGDVELK